MARQKASEIYELIEPYILQNLNNSAIAVAGGVPDPHNLDGSHHVGTLSPTQAPDFFLLDGSRQITGNVLIQSGKTIDGIDISAHAQDAAAHHEPFTGLTADGASVTKVGNQIDLRSGTGIILSRGQGYIRVSADTTQQNSVVAGDGISVTAVDSHTSRISAVSADDVISVSSSGIGVNTASASGLSTSGGLSVIGGHGITVSALGLSVNVTDITGGGLTSDGNTISLGLPASLSVSSQNGVGASTHSHAITTSSNPGASASILSTDSTGGMALGGDVLAVDALRQSVWINSGSPDGTAALKVTARRGTDVALVVKQASQQNVDVIRILDNNNNTLFVVTKDGALKSGNYVSGAAGVIINADGYMEANNIVARGEIRSSVFTAQENHAIGSTVYIRQSAALYSDLIIG